MFMTENEIVTFQKIMDSNPLLVYLIAFCIGCFIFVMILVISLAKYRELSLNDRLEKSKNETKSKQDFLSNMSHEIRTPMNAIIGLTDVINMSDYNLPDELKDKLDKLYSSAHYLLALINNILDMSKIEHQKLLVAIDPFSISSMIHSLKFMLEAEAKRYGVKLIIKKEITNDVILGDELRLKQVLINLLGNAFKFTPSKENVYLSIIEKTQPGDEKITYYFEVKDTGIGIPAQDQERIFKPFEQIYTSVVKGAGTGLGLPISQSIIKLMGGNIKLVSEVNQGSEFSFELKFNPGQIPDEISTDIKANFMKNKKILVVEDNDINAEIMTSFLELKDSVVTRVSNGKEGFEAFRDSPIDYFDLILMDIQMPIMNGLTATMQIRMLDRADAKQIPIIAMTANSFEEDIKEAYDAGMNEFITKPIDVNSLYETLDKTLKNQKD